MAMVATSCASISSVSLGQLVTSSWLVGLDGNWTDPANWSTNPNFPNNGTPPAVSYVAVINADGAPYSVFLNSQVAVSTLNIAFSGATLDMSGGTLSVNNRLTVGGGINQTGGQINLNTGSLNVGDLHGTAIYNHSGGTLNFGQYFEVGVLTNDAARYNLSNAGHVSGGTLLVGANFGSGTFTQTGGVVSLSTMLDMADGVPSSRATYQLDGGTLNVIAPGGGNANIFIGAEGAATFNQTGGAVVIQGAAQSSMVLGDLISEGQRPTGTYNMSGGSLQSPALVAGRFGDGTFLHSGGTHTLSGVIRLGRDVGGTGFYQLSGTGRLISNGVVNVGSAGFGTFVQSGGNYTVNAALTIAAGSTSRGRYTMSGGTLTGTQLTVAAVVGSEGTFEQSGGIASFDQVGGLGTFNASGNAGFTANRFQLFGRMSLADNAIVAVRPNNPLNLIRQLDFFDGATPGGGRLDLANNDLVLTFADVPTVQSQIRTARNGGAWNGFGITSSAAASATPKNTTLGVLSGAEYIAIAPPGIFEGRAVLASDVLVKYTYYGDTDFNGVVNFDDYARVDSGFNNSRTGWLNGDFDYSGSVNFDDYALIDLGFNTQSATLRPVPEPASAALLGGALIAAGARRRKRR